VVFSRSLKLDVQCWSSGKAVHVKEDLAPGLGINGSLPITSLASTLKAVPGHRRRHSAVHAGIPLSILLRWSREMQQPLPINTCGLCLLAAAERPRQQTQPLSAVTDIRIHSRTE
jgi:hypothetical protein